MGLGSGFGSIRQGLGFRVHGVRIRVWGVLGVGVLFSGVSRFRPRSQLSNSRNIGVLINTNTILGGSLL